jgi:hypothetical protein
MLNKMPFSRVAFSMLALSIVFLCGCPDPQKAAITLMSKQGLVLLQPARSYISVGGLVVLPQHGRPSYLDPVPGDVPSSDPSSFDAVIDAQQMKEQTGFSAALHGLATVVAFPVGFTYKGSGSVTMKQIDAAGTRLDTNKVDAVIQAASTKSKATAQLGQHMRVFIVQEVYRATSLSVVSSSSNALEASYGSAGELPSCSDADKAQTDTSKSKSGKPATSSTSPTQTGSQPAKTAATAAKTAAAVSPGASVGVCRSTDGSLTMSSKNPIPFAVRLNELQLVNGILSVKLGDGNFGNMSLGDPDAQKRISIIDPADPVIHGIVRASARSAVAPK